MKFIIAFALVALVAANASPAYEPIHVGPAIIDNYEPIHVGPAIVDEMPAAALPPIVHIIVNTQGSGHSNPVVVEGLDKPSPIPPVIVDSPILPEQVQVVEDMVFPESVNVVNELPVSPVLVMPDILN